MAQKRHTLEVRYKQAFNEADARQQAWNERRDGGKLGLRLLTAKLKRGHIVYEDLRGQLAKGCQKVTLKELFIFEIEVFFVA